MVPSSENFNLNKNYFQHNKHNIGVAIFSSYRMREMCNELFKQKLKTLRAVNFDKLLTKRSNLLSGEMHEVEIETRLLIVCSDVVKNLNKLIFSHNFYMVRRTSI